MSDKVTALLVTIANQIIDGVFDADIAEMPARQLEDEIERRGLQERYMYHLGTMQTSAAYEEDRDDYGWALIRATPEQRARAFLETVKE